MPISYDLQPSALNPSVAGPTVEEFTRLMEAASSLGKKTTTQLHKALAKRPTGARQDTLTLDSEFNISDALNQLKAVQSYAANFENACDLAGRAIIPLVRSELEASYARTGLATSGAWDNPGATHYGWVIGSRILINQYGVLVYVASGMPDKVYPRIASFQHGATHGINIGSRSKKSQTLRKRVKGSGPGVKGGGVWVQAARPMEFTNAQGDAIGRAFVQKAQAFLMSLPVNLNATKKAA